MEKEYNRDYYDDGWEQPEEIDYKEFAECTRVDLEAYDDGGENVELFIGPSCASDEISITLDVYYDEVCSVSASDVYSPSDLIEDFDQYALSNYIDTDCMSCNPAVSLCAVLGYFN